MDFGSWPPQCCTQRAARGQLFTIERGQVKQTSYCFKSSDSPFMQCASLRSSLVHRGERGTGCMFGEGQPRWLMCVGVDTRIGFLCALVQHLLCCWDGRWLHAWLRSDGVIWGNIFKSPALPHPHNFGLSLCSDGRALQICSIRAPFHALHH
jgi:hypothetical protein